MQLPAGLRLVLLLPAVVALAVGVLAGLARLGIGVPVFAMLQAGSHAAFMVGAFFGTVIGLERAVAIGRPWAYLAPLFSGAAGLLWLAGGGIQAGAVLLLLASLLLGAFSLRISLLHREIHHHIMTLGALAWCAGNLVWLQSGAITLATVWWISFLVLTIAGERLELTRYLPARPGARTLFLVIVGLVLAGALLTLWQESPGLQLYAAGLLLLAGWLLRHDIARHTIRQSGLTRYIAACLLSGYVWLAVGGLLGVCGGLLPGDAWRDAALHAILLGFVMSMVFGHAPIILPAVARIALPYHPLLYLPLILLHVTVFIRLLAVGLHQFDWQQIGAFSNALVLLLFVFTVLSRILTRKK